MPRFFVGVLLPIQTIVVGLLIVGTLVIVFLPQIIGFLIIVSAGLWIVGVMLEKQTLRNLPKYHRGWIEQEGPIVSSPPQPLPEFRPVQDGAMNAGGIGHQESSKPMAPFGHKVKCPRCKTIVQVASGWNPVCPTCGYGGGA